MKRASGWSCALNVRGIKMNKYYLHEVTSPNGIRDAPEILFERNLAFAKVRAMQKQMYQGTCLVLKDDKGTVAYKEGALWRDIEKEVI